MYLNIMYIQMHIKSRCIIKIYISRFAKNIYNFEIEGVYS